MLFALYACISSCLLGDLILPKLFTWLLTYRYMHACEVLKKYMILRLSLSLHLICASHFIAQETSMLICRRHIYNNNKYILSHQLYKIEMDILLSHF